MELDRAEKGQAQAAGAVLAEVDSERGHRPEPAKGRAEGEAAVWAVANRADVKQESRVRRQQCQEEMELDRWEWAR